MIRHEVLAMLAAAAFAGHAAAADIRVACYSDGNECEVTAALAQRFMQANPNAVHFAIRIAALKSMRVVGCGMRGRKG